MQPLWYIRKPEKKGEAVLQGLRDSLLKLESDPENLVLRRRARHRPRNP